MEVLIVTFVSSMFCFLNPYTRMGGTELVYNLFAECQPGSNNTHEHLCFIDPATQAFPVIRAIFVALIVKASLTLVTFGIKLPAGIFIPTLGGTLYCNYFVRDSTHLSFVVGACCGRIMGILVQYWQFSYPDSPIFASCKGDLNCVVPGLYAMVGAAAALSGVTVSTRIIMVW